MRLAHYLLGPRYMLMLLFYADDGKATANGPYFERDLLLMMLIFAVLNIPISWKKVGGGIEYEWIGYCENIQDYTLGISAKRSAWVINWIREKLRDRLILLRELREGLGRLSFVAGPLEVVRPFLGPLYAWVAACPPGSCLALPAMISLILWWISKMLFQSRMRLCLTPTEHLGELFRVDAKAEGSRIVLGGWTTGPDPCTRTARWYSVELDPVTAPWAYLKGEPFKVVASLELMATLLAVMLFLPQGRSGPGFGAVGFSAGTDNQGNEFIINKLQTTKFPLCAVLMETAAQLHAKNLNMNLCWRRRDDNQEADDLTNLKFDAFDPERRIPVDVPTLPFIMLNELMDRGGAFLAELDSRRAEARVSSDGRRAKRQRRDGMRVSQPW